MIAAGQRVTVARLVKPDRDTRALLGPMVGAEGVVTKAVEGAPFQYLVRVGEEEWWFRAAEIEEVN